MNYYYFKFKNAPNDSKYIGYLGTIKQISAKLGMSEYQIKNMYTDIKENDYYDQRILQAKEVSKDIKNLLKYDIIMITNDNYIEEAKIIQ